jgi:hypothetical protein
MRDRIIVSSLAKTKYNRARARYFRSDDSADLPVCRHRVWLIAITFLHQYEDPGVGASPPDGRIDFNGRAR